MKFKLKSDMEKMKQVRGWLSIITSLYSVKGVKANEKNTAATINYIIVDFYVAINELQMQSVGA